MSVSIATDALTSSSSGSSRHASVCGKAWLWDRSSFWLYVIARAPHGFPSFSSSRDGPAGIHGACGVTRCARSAAVDRDVILEKGEITQPMTKCIIITTFIKKISYIIIDNVKSPLSPNKPQPPWLLQFLSVMVMASLFISQLLIK